ncbi:hypothetical protein LRS74_15125 [Streptomyces sp. LX-29]|uniref:hypothetical protein n=1 Tax=Streptomyces sp. LX-29 TaxID=2900152 RepID=UPI00240D62C1|nr:hypothetical protein [Streptomyces sp. LX-29]WFB08238.1 hypothetical protein LRS74_15125 [Streptomyces sp. LX-29]
MGWTHDYRDAPSERGSDANANTTLSVSERRAPGHPQGSLAPQGPGPRGHASRIGIPRIIRRRARWVSARLRHHPRSR